MNVNDPTVLDMINSLIASDRLNKSQILQVVDLVSISKNLKELKDNINWESLSVNIKKM